MIELDFKYDPDALLPGGPWPDYWVIQCELGAFEGIQTFIVNGKNFSSSVPIFGFARELKFIASGLKSNQVDEDHYESLSSEWKLIFQKNGELVKIFDHRESALVHFEEFYNETQQYVKRAFDACVIMKPSILNNEFVMEWWNNHNYSGSDYEPKRTERSTLLPINPFYIKKD